MDFIEKLKEALDGLESINEFADPAKDLKRIIRNLAPNIVEHIYKIIVYSKYPQYTETAHHWAAEVRSGLVKFCNKQVKGRNKKVSIKFVYDNIVSKYVNVEELQDIICDCEDQYDNIKLDFIDFKDIYNRILNTLIPLIEYVQSTIRPDVNRIEEIIKIQALK